MKKILGYILLLLAILFVWHSLSPYPFAIAFRTAIRATGEQGNMGPYAMQAEQGEYAMSFSTLDKSQPNAVVLLYKPKNAGDKLPVLLWFHGGGWVSGHAAQQDSYLRLLASHGIAVASVDYALAPENPFPVATEQGILALNRLF